MASRKGLSGTERSHKANRPSWFICWGSCGTEPNDRGFALPATPTQSGRKTAWWSVRHRIREHKRDVERCEVQTVCLKWTLTWWKWASHMIYSFLNARTYFSAKFTFLRNKNSTLSFIIPSANVGYIDRLTNVHSAITSCVTFHAVRLGSYADTNGWHIESKIFKSNSKLTVTHY